jgi:ATP-dependent RNA helicase RhlE
MSGEQHANAAPAAQQENFMTSDDSSMTGDASDGTADDSVTAPKPASAFTDFELPDALQATLSREGLVEPTPIQQMSIPVLLSGEDLIGLAQTGTGKTAAFLLPMLTTLSYTPAVRAGQSPKALVLAPTRELANQISTNLSRLARDMNIRHITVFGGARYDTQIKGLRRGVDVVVATPGRLIDLMDRGAFNPSGISHLVLDEADHMLDLGFFEPIKKIVRELPKDRQTMLFSATMPPQIEQLGQQFLVDPIRVKAPQTGITADKIAQHVTLMPESEKRDRLCDVLNDENTGQCLIFVRTKRRADALAKFMQTRGFAIDALHGDMRQGLRQKVLRNFRDGKLQALIATDVAARGIDVAGLSHVVNFDLTDTPEAYVHRIGRTGRAGLGGLAISFCSPSEEPRLAAIISVVGARVELFDLEGEPVIDFQAKPAPRKRGRPPRARRDSGRSEQNTGPRQSRDAKQTDGKRAKRSGSDNKPSRTKDAAGWSPVSSEDGGAEGRPPRKASRPSGNAKQGFQKDGKPAGKPFGQKARKGGGKFNGKPAEKARTTDERRSKSADRPQRDDRPQHDERPKRDDWPKRDDRPAHKNSKAQPKKGGKPASAKNFGANPFAKPASGSKPDRKTADRPSGKPDRRPSGKKPYRKPGGNNPLRRRK